GANGAPAALDLGRANGMPMYPPIPYTTLFRSPFQDNGEAQPPGCAERTFFATGFDMAEISMEMTRLSISTLSDGSAGQYPKANRSEEHTSELQSRENLVCRLLPENKNQD